MAALSAGQAMAAEPFSQVQRIVVQDLYVLNDLNERVSDQLNSMKPLSNALQYSVSYGSPNISGIQKAKNLAVAFEFSMQQASHPDRAEADRYLLATDRSAQVPQDLRDMVEIVNAKKMELMEFAATLTEIEKALAHGDGNSLEFWIGKLAAMADEIEDKLHNDISVGYEEETPAPLADKI
jgi:alpha-L-fucosidase